MPPLREGGLNHLQWKTCPAEQWLCWACCAGEAADPGDPVEPLRGEDVRQGRMWRGGLVKRLCLLIHYGTVVDAAGLVYGGCRVVMGRSKVQLKVNATIQDSQPGGRKSRGISKGACTGLSAPRRIRPRTADSANGGSNRAPWVGRSHDQLDQGQPVAQAAGEQAGR